MTPIPASHESKHPIGPPLIAGRNYRFVGGLPPGRQGHLYHLHGAAAELTSRRRLLIVEGLTGPDAGLLLVASEIAFVMRYRLEAEAEAVPAEVPVAEPVVEPVAEAVIDLTTKGAGL